MSGIENRQAVFGWLSIFLQDKGLLFTESGFKMGSKLGNHVVDETTGFWQNPNYSRSKPPRWIFNIDLTHQPSTAHLPTGLAETGIGLSNTGDGKKAGLAVRILPLFKVGEGQFRSMPDFEADVLILFHGPLEAGGAADPFSFNVNDGKLSRTRPRLGKKKEDYIFAALLGLRPREENVEFEVNGTQISVSYGDTLDALQAAIKVSPKGGTLECIATYDLSQADVVGRLTRDAEAAWKAAGPPPQPASKEGEAGDDETESIEALDPATLQVPVNPDLLGVDLSVYRQINAVLRSGKQHIMLYGPPGTGKTTLARWIASSLPGGEWTLVTGSSDWSSQDIIGGYQPVGGGDVDFVPGILLRDFDRPLIIDELNRCDIDKVIGPLFTVLSGQQTTLPYRTDLNDKNSQPYVILPLPKAGAAPHEYAPGPAWRLIATINSIDKASLYQMSYALSRRFGWVYVDAPTDLRGFIAAFVAKTDPAAAVPAAGDACPLAEVWAAVNAARVVGSAPIIDAIQAIRELAPGAAFFGPVGDDMRQAALDAIDMVLLPMLDGIVLQDALNIADAVTGAFGLAGADAARVRSRLEAVAI